MPKTKVTVVGEAFLEAITKLHQEGIISPASLLVWATPTVLAMKGDSQTPHIRRFLRVDHN